MVPDSGTPPPRRLAVHGALGIFLAGAIYLACGFLIDWTHERLASGEIVAMVSVLKWTLRAGGAIFVICGILGVLGVHGAVFAYAAFSLVAALLLGIVAYWDWTTPDRYSGIPVVVLAVLAALTAYTAAEEIVLARRS